MKHVAFYPFPKANCEADSKRVLGEASNSMGKLPDHETETDSYAIVTLLEDLGYEFTSDLLVRGCFSATPSVDHRSFASLLEEQIVERNHPNPSVLAYTTAVIKDWENEYTYLDMMRGIKPYGGDREFKLISQV